MGVEVGRGHCCLVTKSAGALPMNSQSLNAGKNLLLMASKGHSNPQQVPVEKQRDRQREREIERGQSRDLALSSNCELER